MAIEIRETIQVRAPIEAVWQFVMDPHKVVTCIPGAQLEEVMDDRTYVGSVKVKVGAVTTSYKGRVQLTQVDEREHVMQMAAEGRETGGGIAKGTMSSKLRSLPDGQTEVVAEATVDLTGRIMQVGRGMIQGVAHQLFRQFAASLKQRLEATQTTASEGAAAVPAAEAAPVRIIPIILHVLWSGIVRFFRRLMGRSED